MGIPRPFPAEEKTGKGLTVHLTFNGRLVVCPLGHTPPRPRVRHATRSSSTAQHSTAETPSSPPHPRNTHIRCEKSPSRINTKIRASTPVDPQTKVKADGGGGARIYRRSRCGCPYISDRAQRQMGSIGFIRSPSSRAAQKSLERPAPLRQHDDPKTAAVHQKHTPDNTRTRQNQDCQARSTPDQTNTNTNTEAHRFSKPWGGASA